MNGNKRPEAAPYLPLADERWELAQRVASSPVFGRSRRLRDFFLYVCESALQGRAGEISEQRIGQAVFGRDQEYNPAVDNIVRVEARNLRAKLAEYFETIGKDDPIVISVPKGCYVPVFEPRSTAALAPPGDGTAAQPASSAAAIPEELKPHSAVEPHSTRRPGLSRAAVLAAVAVFFAATTAWLAYENLGLRRGRAPEEIPFVGDLPWAAVFDAGHQTRVVLADSCLSFVRDVTRQPFQLNDYINRRYLSEGNLPAEIRPVLRKLISRQYTSIADAALVGRIAHVGDGFYDKLTFKYARNMEVRDFRRDHVILLGSSVANPWLELLEPRMNFRTRNDRSAAGVVIVNAQPLPGEQREYAASYTPEQENYSIIALLPNLAQTGNVLIIEGTTGEGTEAAGDFLMSPQFAAKVLPRLGWRRGAPPRYFELLLKSRQIGGASSDTQMVSLRMRD